MFDAESFIKRNYFGEHGIPDPSGRYAEVVNNVVLSSGCSIGPSTAASVKSEGDQCTIFRKDGVMAGTLGPYVGYEGIVSLKLSTERVDTEVYFVDPKVAQGTTAKVSFISMHYDEEHHLVGYYAGSGDAPDNITMYGYTEESIEFARSIMTASGVAEENITPAGIAAVLYDPKNSIFPDEKSEEPISLYDQATCDRVFRGNPKTRS